MVTSDVQHVDTITVFRDGNRNILAAGNKLDITDIFNQLALLIEPLDAASIRLGCVDVTAGPKRQIHWIATAREPIDALAIAFAKRGFATATVEYRVAGEAMFPAAIYDVKAAIRWLRAHAGEFHLDPERFGITGGSAGGNIAVLTAVTFGDSRFEGPANHLDQSSEIQCVVSLYGAMSWTARSWTDSKPGSHLMKETLPDFHIAGGSHLPPILFLNEWDRRKDRRWGADTMEIIKKVGKDDRAELTLINAPHGFIYFSPHQAIALDHLERFFGKHLGQTSQ